MTRHLINYGLSHPYTDKLVINLFNAGDASVFAKALTLLEKHGIGNNLTYEVRLFTDNNMLQSGEALKELLDPEASVVATEAEIFASITEKIIQKEYQDKVKEVLGLEAILTRYQQGTTTNSVVYKRYVDGEYYWMEATYHILDLQENKDIFCYLYVIDIDKQKRQELALKNKAEHDGLTGLYNRSKAINEINQILLSNEMTCGALLMLDMNDFKEINDNYGHAIGDKIITKTAKRLKEMFRNDDILCRLGGDEFMILCRNIDEISIRMKLEDVTRQMKIPYLIEEYQIMAPLSIGFVMIPLYGTTFNNLYKKADIALYKAKQDGLASYRMYHDDMNKKAL